VVVEIHVAHGVSGGTVGLGLLPCQAPSLLLPCTGCRCGSSNWKCAQNSRRGQSIRYDDEHLIVAIVWLFGDATKVVRRMG